MKAKNQSGLPGRMLMDILPKLHRNQSFDYSVKFEDNHLEQWVLNPCINSHNIFVL